MMMPHRPVDDASLNKTRNQQHYDGVFRETSVDRIVECIRHIEVFLADATRTDTSWVAMYHGDFRQRLRGARVLELGGGDGLHPLTMAAIGAHVLSVDISPVACHLLNEAAARLGLTGRVQATAGDFAELELPAGSFDFVVGKAFLHHLTHEVERQYLEKAARLLYPHGEARFAEPAVNSRLLDRLRWMVPVPGRPSSLHVAAFRRYLAADPHPTRDNSARHYRSELAQHFAQVSVVPFGAIERLHRVMPDGPLNRAFRRGAFRAEAALPSRLRATLARAQLVVGRKPRIWQA